MIKNICILDTETTGLSPQKGSRIIEIGLVLYNLEHKSILQCYSTLFPCEENPVEEINHIKAQATQCEYHLYSAEDILEYFCTHADAFVAHNAEFDKKFVATLTPDYDFDKKLIDLVLNKKWICTKAQFAWPAYLERRRLEDICVAMKVPYVNAHRALADCLLLSQCFSNVPDLESRFNSLS